ncbi:MAG: hypothetical protein L7U72_16405, partial [Rubripirellula sp.]|nr:hypothetical protein [Rubripirellula sp.]
NEEIILALEHYLSRKYRVTDSNHSRSTLLGQVRTAGDYRLAERIERIFQREQHHACSHFNDCLQEAEAIVEATEQLNRRVLLRRSNTNALAILAVATAIHFDLGSALANQTTSSINPMLNSEQRAALLSSGCEKFRKANAEDATDQANQMFRQAASDFQLLVDDGIRNDTLFYNLAEAYRYSGRMPLAVANYRSALALSPNNKLYYERLLSLEAERRKDQGEIGWANSDWLITSRRWVVKAIGSRTLQTCFWLGWGCVWALGLAHLTQTLPRSRALLIVTMLICGSSGLLIAAHLAEFQKTDRLVIREPNLEIREGDGEQFTILETLTNADTKLVDLLQQRGDWAYIQWEPDQKGWIRLKDGVPISK